MATVDRQGNIQSSGPGLDGFLAAWRQLGTWLGQEVRNAAAWLQGLAR